MPGIWLFSTDPETYSFEDLLRKGDAVLVYHTQKEKRLVGLARAASDGRPDPKDPAGRLHAVEVEPVRRLRRPVQLQDMKANPGLRGMDFLRIPRLSVSPVTEAEWRQIQHMAGE